jgi:hypothetical protein
VQPTPGNQISRNRPKQPQRGTEAGRQVGLEQAARARREGLSPVAGDHLQRFLWRMAAAEAVVGFWGGLREAKACAVRKCWCQLKPGGTWWALRSRARGPRRTGDWRDGAVAFFTCARAGSAATPPPSTGTSSASAGVVHIPSADVWAKRTDAT